MSIAELLFFTADKIALPLLMFAVCCAFYRIFKGPHLPDRVLGLDFLSSIAIGFVAVYAIAVDNEVLLDIALSVALLSFVGTVAFGYFLEKFR